MLQALAKRTTKGPGRRGGWRGQGGRKPKRRGPAQANLGLARSATPGQDGILEGEVTRVTFESQESGFRVLRVEVDPRQPVETVVGVVPAAPPGTRIRATGRFIEDPKHGRQFQAETLLAVAPSTLEGIQRYLASGMVRGIGPAFARRIVESFGEQTLEVLDRQPERLSEVDGLGPARCDAVAKAWAAHREVGAIMVFLQAHGASPALATRIYKRFGAKAMSVVSQSPYRLALDVWGIGFKTADDIARSVGVRSDDPERAQAGVLQALHDVASAGHVYAEREALIEGTTELLGGDGELVRSAIDELTQAGRLRIERLGVADRSELALFPPNLHDAEQRVAQRLGVLLQDDAGHDVIESRRTDFAMDEFERRSGLQLAPTQRAAVEQAARSKVLVITGGPGVGKTTIVRAILSLFDAARIAVSLGAPTGRAAKRLSEATGREAKTIHRLLEFEPQSGHFKRDRSHPLSTGALVIDETSMVGIELAEALLAAIDDRARLVLVGDVDQLPSVAPGAVLRDIIRSDRVPTVRLTEIFRQAEGSSIVVNAHRIHEGTMPVGAARQGEQFYVIERSSPETATDLVRTLVTQRIPKGFGLDPIDDIQVLTPMQKGTTGAIALNEMLQATLNPTGPEVRKGGRVMRLHDKVMQLRNDYQKEVFNGDIGRLAQVDAAERRLTVDYDGRPVEYEENELDELTLAYATSIHKSQGTEYPAVVVPILTQHFVMLSRNLLYTAVTRGKQLVVLVADPRAVGIALAEVRKDHRQTHLAERLRHV